ncbi:MAG: murein biosynthesis integral membrane protein MurJ [Gammaproteobacteria bacterium]
MGLLRSTAVVSGFTQVSRVLGLVRDIVFAALFGAVAGTDAFFVAFKVPNFLRRMFAEGAFSQAFVPVVSEYRAKREHAEAADLVRHVSGTLGGVLLALTVLAILASPALVWIFAPGFAIKSDPLKFELTAHMLRITFPYLLFISLTALAGGVLNSYGRFAVPAFTPVLLNLSLIGAAIWLRPYPTEPVVALAWGVLIAGVAQLAFQLPFLARIRLLARPRWGWRHPGVRRVLRLMLPAMFGSSVAQINLLFDTAVASFLVTGSVTWLYYSDRLAEYPLGVFGTALGTVILPALSEKHARGSAEDFNRTLDWALRWVLLIGTPATVGLIALAGPLLSTLFQHGKFDVSDVHMASLSLMAYSAGLLGFMGVKILAPGYYARQDTRTPVRIAVVAMLTNIVLNVAFAAPMAYNHIPGAHAGLALATSIAAFVNAGLLLRGLRRAGVYRPGTGWGRVAAQVLVANGIMLALLLYLRGELAEWSAWGTSQRAAHLLGLIAAAAGAYFAALWLLGVRLRQFRSPAPADERAGGRQDK